MVQFMEVGMLQIHHKEQKHELARRLHYQSPR